MYAANANSNRASNTLPCCGKSPARRVFRKVSAQASATKKTKAAQGRRKSLTLVRSDFSNPADSPFPKSEPESSRAPALDTSHPMMALAVEKTAHNLANEIVFLLLDQSSPSHAGIKSTNPKKSQS